MSGADDVRAIATELGMCVSLHRNGELDLERLIAVRDLARTASGGGRAVSDETANPWCPACQAIGSVPATPEHVAEVAAIRENARLRERVAVLTKALRTVAECRGGGAWYCKSGVADAALAQAGEGGAS